jgi:hypothetical protein
MRRFVVIVALLLTSALVSAGGAWADAEHAKPPAAMACPDGFELQPLSFFLDNFGVDLSALDFNENDFLCNKFMPEESQSGIGGVAIDDVAFSGKP